MFHIIRIEICRVEKHEWKLGILAWDIGLLYCFLAAFVLSLKWFASNLLAHTIFLVQQVLDRSDMIDYHACIDQLALICVLLKITEANPVHQIYLNAAFNMENESTRQRKTSETTSHKISRSSSMTSDAASAQMQFEDAVISFPIGDFCISDEWGLKLSDTETA